MEPGRFVREVFVDALHAQVVVVGRDTRFGHRNSGDVSTLRELGAELGFEVDILRDVGADGTGMRWSSTRVRELLADGDVAGAAELLGRPHRVTGIVVHGDHRGRELGYPTANLAQDAQGQVPADGVYAGRLLRLGVPQHAPDAVMPAAISVGTNPTFDGVQRRVEAYVLDRDDLDPTARASPVSGAGGCHEVCVRAGWCMINILFDTLEGMERDADHNAGDSRPAGRSATGGCDVAVDDRFFDQRCKGVRDAA